MSRRPRATVSGFLTVTLAIGLSPVLAQSPEGVSPGAVDRITEVEGRCPNFYWGGVSGAQAYELVVYQLQPELQASDTGEVDLSASDEVLYSRVPGGATAWQPELADGLAPGGSYVWFVRVVLREEAGEVVEAGDWSVGRFFSIPAMPSAEQVRQALEVLQRWEAANGDGSLTRSSAADPDPVSVTTFAADSGSGSGSSRPKSVPMATAAIKGTIPDATGETYGVVGLSNSPDGAGVAAANLAGGPDLVLDGTADGEADLDLYQWGIDRASAGIESFVFMNSIGGGLDLWVQGNVDAIALIGDGAQVTNVDADTLDGTDGADFATDDEAAGLVAAHAASADHDGRYYTESELNTSGAGGAVNWNNLTAVPPGFADGVDDDTTYSPGPGLILDGDQIRIDWGLFHTRTSTLDSVGAVGGYSSIAIGADGLGLISYYDDTNVDLKVAHCDNTACSSATTATLDSVGLVGLDTSIVIGTDGFGLISYFDHTNDVLKVAHCDNTACSSATTATLDS
ncbi:MAG: hypothetical protein V2I67_00600, partial [Thermoanaerobaculales bacterium]|nr:hypothetical protein [Thermoanaerobaculales bacterium]